MPDKVKREADIADMWRRHYQQLLNDIANENSKITGLNRFGSVLTHVGMHVIMKDVKIVDDLTNGKSSGFDGLNSESSKYTNPLVCSLIYYLSVLPACLHILSAVFYD